MGETPKDEEKAKRDKRRYFDTIEEIKKHQETERLKDELAKKYEEGK